MPKTPAALKRTYNAVVTAEVTARHQLTMLSASARPARRDSAVHVVAFTVYVADSYDPDNTLEAIHTAEVTVPARAHDTEVAIVRRAAKTLGGIVGTTWWEYDVTEATTVLADVLAWWVGNVPASVRLSVYTGLAVTDDPHGWYEVMHGGDDYDV